MARLSHDHGVGRGAGAQNALSETRDGGKGRGMEAQRGWMPGVEHIPTRAFGSVRTAHGAMQARAVMSHIMQGSQRTMIEWAREDPVQTRKSVHFTIAGDGRTVQHVGIYDAAWGAGRVNDPTWSLLPAGETPNDYTVQIEHEGFSEVPSYAPNARPYERGANPWPEAMVQASIRVHRWVLGELGLKPDAERVIGHFMTDAKFRPNDPGDAWPRARIIEALGGADAAVEGAPRPSESELERSRVELLRLEVERRRVDQERARLDAAQPVANAAAESPSEPQSAAASANPATTRRLTPLQNLIERLFRTESLATIAATALVATGIISTQEEAIALIGAVVPLVLGRSYVKARGQR